MNFHYLSACVYTTVSVSCSFQSVHSVSSFIFSLSATSQFTATFTFSNYCIQSIPCCIYISVTYQYMNTFLLSQLLLQSILSVHCFHLIHYYTLPRHTALHVSELSSLNPLPPSLLTPWGNPVWLSGCQNPVANLSAFTHVYFLVCLFVEEKQLGQSFLSSWSCVIKF